MTSRRLPWKKFLERILNVHATTSSLDATLDLTPSLWGPMKLMPHFLRRSMLSSTAGLRDMESCIAGAIAMGIPAPMATVAMDVTGVSSIPLAIFEIVLAVAG